MRHTVAVVRVCNPWDGSRCFEAELIVDTWGFMEIVLLKTSSAGVFGAWVGAPGRGVSLASDEPVGRYPTVSTTPRTKPLTPKEGVTPKTPTVKTHPKDGEGVILGVRIRG